MHDPRLDGADAGRLLVVPLVILACGHMLSNMIRTLPAIAVDVMAPDLHSNPHDIASLTAAYHFAFALSQLPVGAALDRFAVRSVALALLAGTAVGGAFAALAGKPGAARAAGTALSLNPIALIVPCHRIIKSDGSTGGYGGGKAGTALKQRLLDLERT